MKARLAFFLLASCIAVPAQAAKKSSEPAPWAQEPDSFMGIRFDQKFVYSVPECPAGFEIPKEICRRAPYQGLYITMGGPSIGFGYGLSVMAKNGPVDSFYLTTPSENYLHLTQLFITKYGPPTSKSTESVKTKGGGAFTNETLIWKGKKIEVVVEKYTSDINTSSATLRTITSKAEAIQAIDQKINGAASKL